MALPIVGAGFQFGKISELNRYGLALHRRIQFWFDHTSTVSVNPAYSTIAAGLYSARVIVGRLQQYISTNLKPEVWVRDFTDPEDYELYTRATMVGDAGIQYPGDAGGTTIGFTMRYPAVFASMASTTYDDPAGTAFIDGHFARCYADARVYERVAGAWVLAADPFNAVPTELVRHATHSNPTTTSNDGVYVTSDIFNELKALADIHEMFQGDVPTATYSGASRDGFGAEQHTMPDPKGTARALAEADYAAGAGSSGASFVEAYSRQDVGNDQFPTSSAEWRSSGANSITPVGKVSAVNRRMVSWFKVVLAEFGTSYVLGGEYETYNPEWSDHGTGFSPGWNDVAVSGTGALQSLVNAPAPSSLEWCAESPLYTPSYKFHYHVSNSRGFRVAPVPNRARYYDTIDWAD